MTDSFLEITKGIHALLGQHADLFQSMGLRLFLSVAICLTVWFGILSALSSAGGGPGFQWAKFVALIYEQLFCYVMLAFYSTPIPGLGISFTGLIRDQAL